MFNFRGGDAGAFLIPYLLARGSASNFEMMMRGVDSPAVRIMKAATDPGLLTSATAPGFAAISSAILESLAATSVLDAMIASGIALPYGPLASVVAASMVEGGSVAEGAPKPILATALTSDAMQPGKAVVMVVVSDDVLRSTQGGAVVTDMLRAAIVRATNSAVADKLVTMATGAPVTGSGSTVEDILTDLAAAASAIGATSTSRLMLITSPATAIKIAFAPSAFGPAFVEASIGSGSIAGMQIFSADSLATGNDAVLFDASRVGVAAGDLALSIARHASIAMDDAGAGNPTFSLWQRNCAAARAERQFALAASSDPGSPAIVVISDAW